MAAFEDHFSAQAAEYARHRPHYPPALFDYLASVAPGRRLAWDCGTGNGQAAIELAARFERVLATDLSADQLALAASHERIEYRLEPAEEVSLPPRSADLVTVAIAVHWFDLDRFYAAVRRVLVPGGILAVWAYHIPEIDPAVDHILDDYYHNVVGGYWPDRFRYVDQRYRTLPFPFRELTPPPLHMQSEWTLDDVAGFLSSWSATQRYREQRGRHPVEIIWPQLAQAWGEPEHRRPVRWPLHLRLGRVDD
jgi:SAM-dependent methyltransferase